MKILGIDPGQKGGLAIFDNGRYYDATPMPLEKNGKYVDVAVLRNWLAPEKETLIAYIEEQHTRGNQGGNFTIGRNYGRIEAVLELLAIPHDRVRPTVWQNCMLSAEKHLCNGNTKEAAIMYCENQGYPVPMTSNRKDASPHDGVADALCIAAYGCELVRVEAMVI